MQTTRSHESDFAAELLGFARSTEPMGLAGPSKGDKRRAAFCGAWPAARDGLAMLETLVPASVRMVIGIVRRAGDAIAGATCAKG